MCDDVDKELCILNAVVELGDFDKDIVDVYKKRQLQMSLMNFKCVCQIIETFHNTLSTKKYNHCKLSMVRVYEHCKDMILKYQGLN